jgi:hypothetical protein
MSYLFSVTNRKVFPYQGKADLPSIQTVDSSTILCGILFCEHGGPDELLIMNTEGETPVAWSRANFTYGITLAEDGSNQLTGGAVDEERVPLTTLEIYECK